MTVMEGAYSERDAVLNEPQICSYCDLIIFADTPCVIIVPLDTPLSGKTKGYGFHDDECLEGWKKQVTTNGQTVTVVKVL